MSPLTASIIPAHVSKSWGSRGKPKAAGAGGPRAGAFSCDRLAPDAGVFRDRFWRGAWLQALPDDARLFDCHIMGDGDGAFCWLGLTPKRQPPVIGPRRYWFNDSGHDGYDTIYPEYNDFFAPHADGEVMADRVAALRALLTALPDAGEIVFRNARAPLLKAAESVVRDEPWHCRIIREQSTWRIDLRAFHDDQQTYPSTRGTSFRAKLRRTETFYAQAGPISLARAVDENDRISAFNQLVSLHDAAWQARGERGAFRVTEARQFHEWLIRNAPEAVDLLTLKAGDQTLGVLYNLISGGVAANYQSGFHFDPANKQVSPGYVSHSHAVADYARRGFHTYDLLAGGDHYKARFADRGETLTTFVLTRSTLRAKLLGGARRLRRMPDRLLRDDPPADQ